MEKKDKVEKDNTSLKAISFGASYGFLLFLLNLESKGMGNVIIRNGRFTPMNVLRFIKSPFFQRWLWKPSLWKYNWILITTFSSFVSYIIYRITKFVME